LGLNWVEDIVSHYYKLKGYLVIENEDLLMPRTPTRQVRGHSDIDVIAIKDDQIIHIECQTWWGPGKKDELREFQRLLDRFTLAPNAIFNKYRFLNPMSFNIVNKFVTSGKPKRSRNGPWDRLETFCNTNNIELIEINTIIDELIKILKIKFPQPEKLGKEHGIARFLIHLIQNKYV